ncbi:hypothetical protein C8J57DRAFT_1234447 [Mycena rebaudengoi]|nr:hypothetical protein C8J57DRAFT_1234447 [Mycena rebaudengoi]
MMMSLLLWVFPVNQIYRFLRPSSSHFTIYQPQLTWIASPRDERRADCPVHVAEFVTTLRVDVKYAGKALLAAPFALHGLNGIRHLSWDLTKCKGLRAPYFQDLQ